METIKEDLNWKDISKYNKKWVMKWQSQMILEMIYFSFQ